MPVIPINKQSFPNLRTVEGNTLVNWNSGTMYAIRLTASLIRIDAEQIQWYTYGRFHASGLWTMLTCLPVRDAFCSIEEELKASVLVLPSGFVNMPLDSKKLNFPSEFQSFVDGIGGLPCKNTISNRILSYTHNRYEMSMCDLVDGNLEVVLKPDTNTLYVREHRDAMGVIILLSILSLYLFMQTCEHLMKLSQGTRVGFTHGSVTVPCIIALSVVTKFAIADTVLILVEEITLQLMLSVYILMHASIRLCLHFNKPNAETEAGFYDFNSGTAIGTLIAAQLLLSLELNETIDSPFFYVYVSLFGVRHFLKFLNLVSLHYRCTKPSTKIKKTLELLTDVSVFGALLLIGMQVSSNNLEDHLSSMGTTLLISVLGGTLAHSITLMHMQAKMPKAAE